MLCKFYRYNLDQVSHQTFSFKAAMDPRKNEEQRSQDMNISMKNCEKVSVLKGRDGRIIIRKGMS